MSNFSDREEVASTLTLKVEVIRILKTPPLLANTDVGWSLRGN